MKKKLLLLSCLFTATMANAQQPKFEWAKSMGGKLSDDVHSEAIDDSGNIYTAGTFYGIVDFDPGNDKFNIGLESEHSFYILKLDASGKFKWAKRLQNRFAYYSSISIALDSKSNIYIMGSHYIDKNERIDMDPGAGIQYVTAKGKNDIFLLKLNSSGAFAWVKQIGGNMNDEVYSLKLDSKGFIYATGSFEDIVDFDPGPKEFYLTGNFKKNMFILKFDGSGNFVWAKRIGTKSYRNTMAIDLSGNIYITGSFNETTDFSTTKTAYFLTPDGDDDIFILKLNNSGDFQWVKKIGGTKKDYGDGIYLDKNGNVFIKGIFEGNVDFDPSLDVYELSTKIGTRNSFIVKLNNSGSLIWAKHEKSAFIISCNIDRFDNIFIGLGYEYLSAIAKLDNNGKELWSLVIGGVGIGAGIGTFVSSVIVNSSNNIFVLGSFYETTDFDMSTDTFNLTSKGGSDIFILKMNQNTISEIPVNRISPIRLYPNPCSDILNFEIGNEGLNKFQIQVFNSIGQIVIEESPTIQHSHFNIQHLPAGLYFVKVISDNQIVATQKIIKY